MQCTVRILKRNSLNDSSSDLSDLVDVINALEKNQTMAEVKLSRVLAFMFNSRSVLMAGNSKKWKSFRRRAHSRSRYVLLYMACSYVPCRASTQLRRVIDAARTDKRGIRKFGNIVA